MSRENLRDQGISPEYFDRNMFTQFQTWLGETKRTEGCPANCKYCFFKLDGLTPMRLQRLASPEIVLELTKRQIPNHFIELSKEISQDVVFYISYSGLAGTELEPTVVRA